MRVMNKPLQVKTIKKILEKHGISSDTVDVEALVDSSLHLDENIREISKKLGLRVDLPDYDDEEKANELLHEWLIMNLGDEAEEILEELEEQEEYKEEIISEIREEVEQLIRESDERIAAERKSRLRQLHEYWEEKRKIGILFDYMASLIAPHLVGEQYHDIRRAVLIVLASYTDLSTTHRTRVHLFLTGEPGAGKTEILKWIEDYLSEYGFKTVYVDGTRMSKAGLTIDARGKEPRYGALVNADRGLLLLDELDKAKAEDMNALLSAMEHGKFKVNIGGIDEYFNAEVRVIATSNYIDRIPPQLLDRFDFIFEVKRPSIEERKEEVDLLVDSFFGDIDPSASAFELAMFLQHIANFTPKIVPEEKEKIKQLFKAYIDLRRGGLSEMSRRQFEVSVLRIAYTYAKIHMRDLRANDVLEAIRLKDPEVGKNKTLLMTLLSIASGRLQYQ